MVGCEAALAAASAGTRTRCGGMVAAGRNLAQERVRQRIQVGRIESKIEQRLRISARDSAARANAPCVLSARNQLQSLRLEKRIQFGFLLVDVQIGDGAGKIL